MGNPRALNTLRLRWMLAICAAAFCAMWIFRARYQVALVVGGSMRPTLNPGDLLVVDKTAYEASEPTRDDIIVARYRNDLVVKRIVALPGEEVEVKQGNLYIDGVVKAETHPTEPGFLDVDKGRLLPGRFATLGDNRSVMRAQAVHPIVSKENIVGKVLLSLRLSTRPGWTRIAASPRSN